MTTLRTANGLNCGHWVDPNIETHLQLKEMFVTKNRCFYSVFICPNIEWS